jgi:Flp pilus assembly protein TadB
VTLNSLVADLAIAAVCAVVVLIISPGVAVDAMIAVIVLAACGASYALGRRRRRRRRHRRA